MTIKRNLFGIFPLLVIFNFIVNLNAFNYMDYLDRLELATARMENFTYQNVTYSIIFVKENPTFLLRNLKNGSVELVLENDKDFSDIVESYVEFKMHFSMDELQKLKILINKYNQSLHSNATIQSMEFPDPFYFCGRQFGIDIYQNKDCTTKASCQSIISVYCAARPGYCPDIGELSNNLFLFIDAGRVILKNINLFNEKLNSLNVTSSNFKSQVAELLNITKTLQQKSDVILKSKMRFPEKGISECPDCYGVCPYVPLNKTTLVEIEKILSRWKNSTYDRDTVQTLLYLGLEKVRKIDKERKILELKKNINATESKMNASVLFSRASDLLSKVDDSELRSLYQNALNAKSNVENAANFAQELTFQRALNEYEIALRKLGEYDFNKFNEELELINKNREKIIASIYYLKYLDSPNLADYTNKLSTLETYSSYPIKAETIQQIIDAQKLLLSQTGNEIERNREELGNIATLSYFSSSLSLANPLLKLMFKEEDLQPEKYISILLLSMLAISLLALLSIGSLVILVSLFIWYGFLKRFAKNSLVWKVVYGILVILILGIVFSLDTYISLRLSKALQQNNPLAFTKFMFAQQKAVVLLASKNSDIVTCSEKLYNALPFYDKYLFDITSNQCIFNNEQINYSTCLQKVRAIEYPTIIITEGSNDLNLGSTFFILPKPFATLNENIEFYKICVPEELFASR
ncbi:MAG: hypothetical protein QXF76_01590 [Candidatus Anstonellales archaeon]